jgi:hypothetical protein
LLAVNITDNWQRAPLDLQMQELGDQVVR